MADLNLRAPYYDSETVLWTLRHCDVLKLNRGELAEVSQMLGARGSDEDLFVGLLSEFGPSRGVLTAGGDGAWIFEDGVLTHEPAVPATGWRLGWREGKPCGNRRLGPPARRLLSSRNEVPPRVCPPGFELPLAPLICRALPSNVAGARS